MIASPAKTTSSLAQTAANYGDSLLNARIAGGTATLAYDPLGRLWQVVKGSANTRFLTDGDALVAEYDGTGAVTNRYVHGSNAAADAFG